MAGEVTDIQAPKAVPTPTPWNTLPSSTPSRTSPPRDQTGPAASPDFGTKQAAYNFMNKLRSSFRFQRGTPVSGKAAITFLSPSKINANFGNQHASAAPCLPPNAPLKTRGLQLDSLPKKAMVNPGKSKISSKPRFQKSFETKPRGGFRRCAARCSWPLSPWAE